MHSKNTHHVTCTMHSVITVIRLNIKLNIAFTSVTTKLCGPLAVTKCAIMLYPAQYYDVTEFLFNWSFSKNFMFKVV